MGGPGDRTVAASAWLRLSAYMVSGEVWVAEMSKTEGGGNEEE